MSAADGTGVPADLAVSRLYTAVVSDILDGLGHRDHTLDPAIRPLRRGEVIAGFANSFLVTEVHRIPAEPYTGEIGALDDIRPGEVILGGRGRIGPCRLLGRAVLRGSARPRSTRHPHRRVLPRRAPYRRPRLPGVVPGDTAAGLQGPDRGDRVAAACCRRRPAGPA